MFTQPSSPSTAPPVAGTAPGTVSGNASPHAASNATPLRLHGGWAYGDLFESVALARLDGSFRAELKVRDGGLSERFERYRNSRGESLRGHEESALLIEVAVHLEAFVARLFGVEAEVARWHVESDDERAVMRCKQLFWKKRGAKLVGTIDDTAQARARMRAVAMLVTSLEASDVESEVAFARAILPIVELEERCAKVLAKGGAVVSDEELTQIETWHTLTAKHDFAHQPTGEGRIERARSFLHELLGVLAHGVAALAQDAGPHALRQALEGPQRPEEGLRHPRGWVMFRAPSHLDAVHLVHVAHPNADIPELSVGPHDSRRARDGFSLTDARMSRLEVANEVEYCILCQDREKDSCRRGLAEPLPKGTKGVDLSQPGSPVKTPKIKLNTLGVAASGCPLDERIGELHALRREGRSLAGLAVVVIDNPMCPGTGHRICNDCMKGCIYQKQDPVNIPQAETGALTDVLNLPWGVEIYGLLTRWNPLNARRPYMLPYNGKNVLVVGMGPAGYTLAHHLMQDGFGVVGIDGLKIERLPASLVGDSLNGVLPTPVRDYASIEQDLASRTTVGFGGVAEYGITIRWDKNFLDLIAMSLLRRKAFRLYGGVRFGGTISVEDAWQLGFHHVAIAAGAGKPTLIDVPNGLARGVRQASDFLMALQLTGAFKRDSLANLQVRLPALVIGGGLTGIDTATELAAYYVVQAERTLKRIETLIAEQNETAGGLGEERVFAAFDAEEQETIAELCTHGRAIRREREVAEREGRAPQFEPLLEAWGGVTLAYRRTMVESPAYRLNHEEIIKAFEEGIRFVERVSPKEVLIDGRGAAEAMIFDRMEVKDGKLVATGETLTLPARTICIAAGTSPNVTYEHERPGTFAMDPKTRAFVPHRVDRDEAGTLVATPDPLGFFTGYTNGTHAVSFYGDNLPRYAGSVVRAMASAKDGAPHVAKLFAHELSTLDGKEQSKRNDAWIALAHLLDDELLATVHDVIRLTPTIVEVVVRAPRAARGFEPGQFYRLQNFEHDAVVVEGTKLVTEGMALTGAWVDKERGLLSTIVLEMGGSSRLCATLKKGQQVVLMGPTGAPTEIAENENVVLAGGGLGNAVLFSIGKALRARGCKVVYFAGYRNPDDVFHEAEIEAAADMVVWACDRAPSPPARRPQDASYVGNIVQAMVAYAKGELGAWESPFKLKAMDRIIAIGSDRMMAAVKKSRDPGGALHPFVRADHVGIASINSPMQCMMKEICAQCLQRQVDPATGKVTMVFTCSNQDQDIDKVDFPFLGARLRASSAQEKLTALWLDRVLAKAGVERV